MRQDNRNRNKKRQNNKEWDGKYKIPETGEEIERISKKGRGRDRIAEI